LKALTGVIQERDRGSTLDGSTKIGSVAKPVLQRRNSRLRRHA
jgi:hypothetical protein